MDTTACRHISVSIDCPFDKVYDFIADPRHLSEWASGLSDGSPKQEGNVWIARSPMGKVRIQFAEKNPFGIVDHDVTLESGVTVHNPMRVLRNGNGSEVVFTLFRQSDMTSEKFNEDAKWVEKDLKKLKELLEK